MGQEFIKFIRSPIVMSASLLILFLGVFQPKFSNYGSAAAIERYGMFYDAVAYENLSESEKDVNYYIKTDPCYAVAKFYKEETEEREGYKEFRKKIEEQADKSTMLFSADSFVARNAQKQIADYKTLGIVFICKEASLGVVQYAQVSWADGALLGFGGFLCLFLVTREKEYAVQTLLKTTKKGYRYLYLRKLSAVLLMVGILYVICQIGRYLLCGWLFGYGDLNRSVQSIKGLSDSVLSMRVGELLLLSTVLKGIALLAAIAVIFCITLWLHGIVLTGLCIIGCLGAAVACMKGISQASVWTPLRYLNMLSLLDAFHWLGNYQNFNICSWPVSRSALSLIIVISMLIGSVLLVVFVFPYQTVFGYGHRWRTVRKRSNHEKKVVNKTCRVHTLYLWEMYKLLRIQKVGWIFAALLLFSAATYHPSKSYPMDWDETFYKIYHTELAGEQTKAKKQYLKEEGDKFERLLQQYNITDEEDLFVKKLKNEILLNKMLPYEAYLHVNEVAEYIGQDTARQYVYDTGYEKLFTDKGKQNHILLMTQLLLASLLSFSGLLVNDKAIGINSVLMVTYHGKKRLNRVKFEVGVLLYTMLFLIIYLPRVFAIYEVYGFPGLDAPAQSLIFLSWMPQWISIGMGMVMYHIAHYLIGLFYLGIVYGISKRAAGQVQSLFLSAGVGIGILFVYAVVI